MSWKDAERLSAKRAGGKRIPITGRARGSTPDHTTGSGLWAVEYKMRSKLPKLLHDAMDQAVRAKRGEQTPIVIFHEKYKNLDEDYVLLRRTDFERIERRMLAGEVEAECAPGAERKDS